MENPKRRKSRNKLYIERDKPKKKKVKPDTIELDPEDYYEVYERRQHHKVQCICKTVVYE